jgi:hypothetical protein
MKLSNAIKTRVSGYFLGEGIVNYFEVKNCSEILVFEAVGSCNRFLMLNLG